MPPRRCRTAQRFVVHEWPAKKEKKIHSTHMWHNIQFFLNCESKRAGVFFFFFFLFFWFLERGVANVSFFFFFFFFFFCWHKQLVREWRSHHDSFFFSVFFPRVSQRALKSKKYKNAAPGCEEYIANEHCIGVTRGQGGKGAAGGRHCTVRD
jgi:hypothetical protein